jgi:F0F1-type ATP synthase membrane subunit c/vacuolar-type H+-ATPase subunit K
VPDLSPKRKPPMRNLLAALALCLCLIGPALAQAAAKDPLSYPLKHYAFILATALLGGFVSWYTKVRKGELRGWSMQHLVGELATSALAGLLAFWVCEAAGLAQLWTAALVGIAGHMGTRAIGLLESWAAKKLGVEPRGPQQ